MRATLRFDADIPQPAFPDRPEKFLDSIHRCGINAHPSDDMGRSDRCFRASAAAENPPQPKTTLPGSFMTGRLRHLSNLRYRIDPGGGIAHPFKEEGRFEPFHVRRNFSPPSFGHSNLPPNTSVCHGHRYRARYPRLGGTRYRPVHKNPASYSESITGYSPFCIAVRAVLRRRELNVGMLREDVSVNSPLERSLVHFSVEVRTELGDTQCPTRGRGRFFPPDLSIRFFPTVVQV